MGDFVNGTLVPREETSKLDKIFIMWSRQEILNTQAGTWYQPNHFIPLVYHKPKWSEGQSPIKRKQKSTRKITSFFWPPAEKKLKVGTSVDATSTSSTSTDIKHQIKVESCHSTVRSLLNTKLVKTSTVKKWGLDYIGYAKEDGFVKKIWCNICRDQPEEFLKKLHGGQRQVVDAEAYIVGTSRVKKANAVDHAKTAGHISALNITKQKLLHVKKKHLQTSQL